MPFDFHKVRVAIGEGVSPVCASCSHYWTSIDRGRGDCGQDCGGPIVGRDFPKYAGPMTTLDKFCFACTTEAAFAIKAVKSQRLVGVCRTHLGLVDRLMVMNSAVSEKPDILSSRGIVLPVNGRYTPATLSEVMYETEEKWKTQDEEIKNG